jgi:hypothetical protein
MISWKNNLNIAEEKFEKSKPKSAVLINPADQRVWYAGPNQGRGISLLKTPTIQTSKTL